MIVIVITVYLVYDDNNDNDDNDDNAVIVIHTAGRGWVVDASLCCRCS